MLLKSSACPPVELTPNTDPFFVLNHIFDTYRTLQNHLQRLHVITLSTIHGNDFLEKLVFLEIPPHFPTSFYPFRLFLHSNSFKSTLFLQISLKSFSGKNKIFSNTP